MFSVEPLLQWHLQLATQQETLHSLQKKLQSLQETHTLYPPAHQIFHAFSLTPFETVKVVILGQDPYHGKGQAHGLAFSVPPTAKIPPSLRNIYKELEEDCHIVPPTHGDLTPWATQGVFLLNTCLTVQEGKAGSHHGLGWETLTDTVLSLLCQKNDPLVFLLWGNHAIGKKSLLERESSPHMVLTTTHPSPLSAYRGFMGCQHFSKANSFLETQQKAPIQWQV